jgi:phosphopantetheinyl transferase
MLTGIQLHTTWGLTCPAALLQLQFLKNEHGKPFLLPESASAVEACQTVATQLQFNLSHTSSLLGKG